MRKQIRNEIVETLFVLENKCRQIKETSQTALFMTCVGLLQSIKKKCKKNLSEQRFLFYAEIFDGILLALQKRERLNHDRLLEVCDLCMELLQFAEKELRQEKEVKKEIVFLPYKASMWDSLESIWRAAAADTEHCEAYVVPIPYCERKPDGSAAQWYCEANLFPADVPVVDYRKYDIAERRPDVIYIHNPYDGNNIVTSVDSRYYSYELKKYTDMLVYVPYFVVGGRWPEAHTTLSCYPHMDKIVVQRDHMQIAPNTDSDILENDIKYLSDYIPEEKIIPLGSPKIDRVFYCEQHKKVPKEWQDRIKGKKIILYNISISGLLQFGEKALKKMKYVFECFSGRKDVVLLWRPHPLLESTMKSMRTDLYDEYKRLEKEFLDKKIGILDKTPDINMAVAIADAYLGEETSSVINLFGVMAKPIFITDDMMFCQRATEDEKASIQMGAVGFSVDENQLHTGQLSAKNVYFDFWGIEQNKLLFIAEGYNTLCSMHLPTGMIAHQLKFKDFPCNGYLYATFLCLENRIYFSPSAAKNILIYDLETGKEEEIPIEKPLEYGNYSAIVPYKNHLFFMPNRQDSILRYDRTTGDCKYYREWLSALETSKTEAFLGWGCMKGCTWIAPALQMNKIMEFDFETGKSSFVNLPGLNVDCSGIFEDEDEDNVYWLLPWKTTTIRKWNRSTNTCKFYNTYPDGYQCMKDWNNGATYCFSGVVQWNGKIWLSPCYGNMFLRLDKITGKIDEVDIGLPYGIYDRKSAYYMQQNGFCGLGLYEKHFFMILSNYDRRLILFDLETEKIVRMYPLRFTQEQVELLSTPLKESFGKLLKDIPFASNENRLWRNIDTFIDYVISDVHPKAKQQMAYTEIIANTEVSCGSKVHQYIMERIDV